MTDSQSENSAARERRNCYRCPVTGSRMHGQLKIGEQEVAVEVLDESANGFSVLLEGIPDCGVGDQVLLQIASDWTEARVMNLATQAAAGPAESNGPAPEVRTRLGLMRISDWEVVEVDPRRKRLTWADVKTLARPLSPVLRVFTKAMGLAIGAPLIAVILVWTLEHSVTIVPVIDDNVARPAKDPVPPVAKTEGPRARAARPLELKIPIARKLNRVAAVKQIETFLEEHIRFSSPERLLEPELAKLLALTREQADELRKMVEEFRTSDSGAVDSEPAAPTAGGDDPELELGRRSLAILTQEQRNSLVRHLSTTKNLTQSSAPAEASAPAEGE